MNPKLSLPTLLVGLCCIGILAVGYMPDDLPLQFVESHTSFRQDSRDDAATAFGSDGRNVYLSMRNNVVVFRRDEQSGKLSQVQRVDTRQHSMPRASTIAVNPASNTIYLPVTGSHLTDTVWCFQRDNESGRLTEHAIERPFVSGLLNSLDGFACASDGKHLYMIGRAEHVLIGLSCQDDCSFDLVQCFQDDVVHEVTTGSGYVPPCVKNAEIIDALQRPEAILITPDDRFVYVGAADDAALNVFKCDVAAGRLKQVQKMTSHYKDENGKRWSGSPEMYLGGVCELAFSPKTEHIYSLSSNAVSVFHRDQESGKISFASAVSGFYDSIPSLEKASSIVVSKSGKHVFIASHGDKFSHRGAITIFKRDLKTGELEFLKVVDRKEVAGVRHLSLSPDGRHLYASTSYQTLAVFAVNEEAPPIAVDPDAKSSVD